MRDLVISVPDKEYPFFLKMVKKFNFVTVRETDETPTSKKQFLNDLRDAVEEVNNMKAGNKKNQSLKEFLDEL